MLALIQALKMPASGAVERLRYACAQKVAHRGLVSLADQVIVSGTSFLTTILLGRNCLPEELGVYSVGFSLAVAIFGIPKALIWTPYTTFLPSMPEDERRWYSGSTFAHQVLLSALLAVGVSASGAAVCAAGGAQSLGVMLMVLGPAMALIFMRECVRRVCFSQLLVGQALAVDVVVSALQIGGLSLLAAFGSLSAVSAYLVIGTACVPVIAVWLFSNRQAISLRRGRVVADLAKNWKFARWLFAGALAYSVNDTLYFWVLSLLHGTAAVGMLSAANGAIFLTNPLILGVSNFFGPHAAHVYARVGMQALQRQVTVAWAAVTAMMLLFTLSLVVWGAPLVAFLFGAKYAGQENVIIALALGQFGDVVTIPFTLGLLAVGRGDSLLKTYVIRLAITATIGMWCVDHFGAPGVGYGQALSNLGAALAQWWIFRSLALPAESES